MSREIRTPLDAIVNIARILLDRFESPLTPQQKKQSTFDKSSTPDRKEMVDDLMNLAEVAVRRVTTLSEWSQLVDLLVYRGAQFSVTTPTRPETITTISMQKVFP